MKFEMKAWKNRNVFDGPGVLTFKAENEAEANSLKFTEILSHNMRMWCSLVWAVKEKKLTTEELDHLTAIIDRVWSMFDASLSPSKGETP